MTAALGADSHPDAVLDSKLRVRGSAGLRESLGETRTAANFPQ